MPKHCVVKGCKSNLRNGFPFPKDRPEFIRKWIQALEKHQELIGNYQKKLVCPAHFLESDFLKSKKNQISKKAVPSVFPSVPDDYMSEEEKRRIPKSEIKHEPEDYSVAITKGGKTLRNNRTTLPIAEPDSEEDLDSNYEPTDSNDGMSVSEPESEKMFDYSQNKSVEDVPARTVERESAKNADTSIAFQEVTNDEIIDSDYEPVTETVLEALQEKFSKKSEILKKEASILDAMEEMMQNQAATIRKLEEELMGLTTTEINDKTSGKSASDASSNLPRAGVSAKNTDYSDLDLQVFSISLYYFSPKVYAYLESIMPYLPPKTVVVEWIKSGRAFKLFPPGVLLKENFVLE